MGYNLAMKGMYWGYNPLTNHEHVNARMPSDLMDVPGFEVKINSF